MMMYDLERFGQGKKEGFWSTLWALSDHERMHKTGVVLVEENIASTT